jgi:hypothetical protein
MSIFVHVVFDTVVGRPYSILSILYTAHTRASPHQDLDPAPRICGKQTLPTIWNLNRSLSGVLRECFARGLVAVVKGSELDPRLHLSHAACQGVDCLYHRQRQRIRCLLRGRLSVDAHHVLGATGPRESPPTCRFRECIDLLLRCPPRARTPCVIYRPNARPKLRGGTTLPAAPLAG